MIKEFVERFDASRATLLAQYKAKAPDNYEAIVKDVIGVLGKGDDCDDKPDPARIHKIDDGDYQGTFIFVIGAEGYQPSTYWYVSVGYGSCSGCDTFEAIGNYSDEPPTDEQANQYLTLALHVVQGLKKMGDAEP